LLPALASPQAPQHQHVENVFTYQLLTSGWRDVQHDKEYNSFSPANMFESISYFLAFIFLTQIA
jgi:hypothetical protein